ncbi:cellulose synthase [Heterostelium album PN500]|uniref:Cellulose synthase n=1 Tax=Heterostelium pallidum (strain ATCC 26659 / Pp 5 / PN500) TaxID=670386 RepID=D3B596_HETP5|nr:cellulose synthase [Heterostelium album PN500]EFA83461.1 cellulose synthase [Heterostelium album PN500]|eukprot:XP_020435578.1 cellulose synthase [Heterostelium album PN500]
MEGGDIPLNTPTSPQTTTTTTTTNNNNNNSGGSSSNNSRHQDGHSSMSGYPSRMDSSHQLMGLSGSGSSRNLKPKPSSNNIKWKWNNKDKPMPMDRELAKKKVSGRKDSERKLKSSTSMLKKKNTIMDFGEDDGFNADDGNITEGLPISEGIEENTNAHSPLMEARESIATPRFETLIDPDITPAEMEEKMRQHKAHLEMEKTKEREQAMIKKKSQMQVKRKVTSNTMQDDSFETLETIIGEEKKEVVFEVKPYFSHSILQATMAVFLVWNLFYFAYRAGWTINTHDVYTMGFSALFFIVEFVSFLATALHLNNFTNPCTFILVVTLEQILAKRRKKFPNIMMYITTYKEPPSIVSRTFRTAIAMDYPSENLWIGLLDDSANFRESRGWAHLQSVEKNFLFQLLQRAIYAVHNIAPPMAKSKEDPHGILSETSDRIATTTKEVVEAEVQWFIEYFLLNSWFGISQEEQREADDSEKSLISKLRDDNFSPYRTFSALEREKIDNFTVESLQSLWHGNAMYRPLIRSVLIKKDYVRNYIRELNNAHRLRFLNTEALAMAQYSVLMMGRQEVPFEDVSTGNVRIDFEPSGTVVSPKCTYLRRRKPPIPHNKAGNINNALFNESTKVDFEFIGLLDADQQPHPDFLKRVMPYFYSDEGSDCAFVQTPQFFSNIYPVDDPLGHRNMEFYGPVMEGRSANGACPFVGTNAVFRRQPLYDIGGIMYNSVTEDMYTGMKLQVSGYKSWYHNEVLVVGTAPVDIKETLEQRKRWAQGAVEIFSLTPWSYIRTKLGWRKMLYNLDSCIYPFLSPTAFFYGLSPLIMCLWTVPIVVTDPVIFILVGMIPVMILPRVIQYMILRARRPYEAGRSGPSLWVEATDLWRAEQTFFAFAGTYIAAWKAGSASIVRLLKQRRISRHKLAMWNWKRDFVKKPTIVESFRQAKLVNAAEVEEETGTKKTEQSFRSSNKESDTIKNSRLFLANIFLFGANIVAILLTMLRFNCFQDDMWLLIVVAGFAFSTCWHLWSFIPMALRQSEKQWPYASSYHAHNIVIFVILGFLVLLFVKVKVCIPRIA